VNFAEVARRRCGDLDGLTCSRGRVEDRDLTRERLAPGLSVPSASADGLASTQVPCRGQRWNWSVLATGLLDRRWDQIELRLMVAQPLASAAV